MNILNISYPFSPVSASTSGGAEQIIWLLDNFLVNKGHKSMVVAHENSDVLGRHFFINLPNDDINKIKEMAYKEYRNLLSRILTDNKIDVIHMHGIDFYEYLPDTDIPILVTVHLPPEWYPEHAFELRRRIFFNCVSETEQKKMKYVNNLLPFISNGIRTDLFNVSDNKGNYCLGLGRICWDKGYHAALEAARKAGVPFYLAGEIYNFDSHKEYFERNIEPWLDGKDYRYLGPINFEKKGELLSEARCVLIPSLAEETSSLVAMEALASGTPVIGFNIGALPEIIEDRKTGFIVSNSYEMAEAIKKTNRISPIVCRSEAIRRFSAVEMTSKYFSLYSSLVKNPEYMAISCW